MRGVWTFCFCCRMNSMTVKTINTTIRKCKGILARHYDNKLKGVILFGSMACGQASLASDIDLLVLLSPPSIISWNCVNLWMYYTSSSLNRNNMISAMPVSASEYELGSASLYRNAR